MGEIYLSCGHTEPTKPTGWDVYFEDTDEFGDETLVSASYCVNCISERMKSFPENTFFTFDEAWEAVFGKEN